MKQPVTFGDITVNPGEIGYGTLTSVQLPDSTEVKLPFILMNGAEDGPKFMVSGAVHGGELIGYPVILRLLKKKLDPSKGFGESKPLCVDRLSGEQILIGDNATPLGRKLNRRIEVVFSTTGFLMAQNSN